MSLNSLRLNKSSMRKKGLLMSLDVAQNVELPEKNKLEIAVAAAVILVNHVKCSLLFVLLVEKRPLYLSNLLVTNQCIAVTATNPVHVVIGNILDSKTFPGFYAWKGFLFLKNYLF
ncbi:conserved hypothetical protein [Candidatus Desulfosporosinus infrequens]|uniref:Uncharacterized protein n=1 Tax=Candidatus Desulfosporosinus infrequens TaxID=2043169 RepID=A0A2U3KD29_9FIRM|nr:conserved hypothetical protein [Candidatus Desulfosporosinus infrequens]